VVGTSVFVVLRCGSFTWPEKLNNEELNIFLFIWASTLKRCVEASHVDPSKHGSDEKSYNTLVEETSGLGDVSVKERSS
jgi:hypothetical protein